MAERLKSFLHNMTAAFAQVKIKNVMNPVLMFVLASGIFALAASIFSSGAIVWICDGAFAVSAILYVFAYLFFLFKDPGRLQSEEYQIKSQALEMVQQHGSDGLVGLDALVTITTPEVTERIECNAGESEEA